MHKKIRLASVFVFLMILLSFGLGISSISSTINSQNPKKKIKRNSEGERILVEEYSLDNITYNTVDFNWNVTLESDETVLFLLLSGKDFPEEGFNLTTIGNSGTTTIRGLTPNTIYDDWKLTVIYKIASETNARTTAVNLDSFTTLEFFVPTVLSAYAEPIDETSVIFYWEIKDDSNVISELVLKDGGDALLNLDNAQGGVIINDLQTKKYSDWNLEIKYKNSADDTTVLTYEIDTFNLGKNSITLYIVLVALIIIILLIILLYILYRFRERRMLKNILKQEQERRNAFNYNRRF